MDYIIAFCNRSFIMHFWQGFPFPFILSLWYFS